MVEVDRLAIAKSLTKAFEDGTSSAQRVAYCGGSLEAIQQLLLTGTLPIELIEPTAPFRLHFVPIKDSFQLPSPNFLGDEQAYQLAAELAGRLAKAHYLLDALKLDITTAKNQKAALILTSEPDIPNESLLNQLARRTGVFQWEIQDTIQDAKKRKGVVVVIGKSLHQTFKRFHIGKESFLQTLEPDKRLDIKHICGIEPLGDEECDYFANLQEEVANQEKLIKDERLGVEL